MADKKIIVITERASDFHAQLKDRPEIWGCGKTPAVAIGDLTLSHKDKFDIEIENSNWRTEFKRKKECPKL